VHTPDKSALLARLPDGNREAALDLLGADHSLARKALDRTLAWAKVLGGRARMIPEAVREAAGQIWRPRRINREAEWAETQHQGLNHHIGHSTDIRADHGPSMGL